MHPKHAPPVDAVKLPLHGKLTDRYPFAWVDPDTLARFGSERWGAHQVKRGKAYITRISRKRPSDRLHRLVMNAPRGRTVVFLDGDSMNCTRANLAFADELKEARTYQVPRDPQRAQETETNGMEREDSYRPIKHIDEEYINVEKQRTDRALARLKALGRAKKIELAQKKQVARLDQAIDATELRRDVALKRSSATQRSKLRDAEADIELIEEREPRDRLQRLVDVLGPPLGYLASFFFSCVMGYLGLRARFGFLPEWVFYAAPILITLLCSYPTFYSKMYLGKRRPGAWAVVFAIGLTIAINAVNLVFNTMGGLEAYRRINTVYSEVPAIDAQIANNQAFLNAHPAQNLDGKVVKYKKEITRERIRAKREIDSLIREKARRQAQINEKAKFENMAWPSILAVVCMVLFPEIGLQLSTLWLVIRFSRHKSMYA